MPARLLACGALALVLVLAAVPSRAQQTGGSFGSSNWSTQSEPTRAEPTRAEPTRAEPTRAEPTSLRTRDTASETTSDASDTSCSTQLHLGFLLFFSLCIVMGSLRATRYVTAGVVGVLGLLGALAGNGTEGKVPRSAPRGFEIEIDVGRNHWVNGEVVRWGPDGTLEVRVVATPDMTQTVARQRIRYRFGAMWSSIGLWSPGHFLLVVEILVVLLLIIAQHFRVSDASDLRALFSGTSPPLDVEDVVAERPREGTQAGVIQLAFDHSRRERIQSELAALAESLRGQLPGMQFARAIEALAAHATALRGAASRWEEFEHPWRSREESLESARRSFEHFVNVERGRYVVETVRGDTEGVRRVAVEVAPRAEEGGGFVVVSVVLAWKGQAELFANPAAPGRLATLAEAADNPLCVNARAFEIVWVPATPTDVMSSAELVVVFPDIRWIDAAADRVLGRIVCESCATVYAGELGRCPHCGAPRDPPR